MAIGYIKRSNYAGGTMEVTHVHYIGMELPKPAKPAYFPVPAEVFLWFATFAVIVLSVMSALNICSNACSQASRYLLFGYDFGWFGVIYFSTLMAGLCLQHRFVWAERMIALLICAAAGAEMRFIWLQKFVVGRWCPLCLSIAVTVYTMTAVVLLNRWRIVPSRREKMKTYVRDFLVILIAIVLGLTGAILGTKKEAGAAEMNLFLGKSDSSTVVYFVSDWFCPACRRSEPVIEQVYARVSEIAKVGFVDVPVHPETSNFTPYNLQFLAHEKGKYIQLRKALSELAKRTKTPSAEDVQKAIDPYGVKLHPMNYADIANGMSMNENVFETFEIRATPTVVVSNSRTGKHLNLVGEKEISYPAIAKAITEVGR
jgi:protein-disulfide isomerase